jgi:3-phenylpropionate/cinnamic acid dioxygenase small subunit
MSKMTALIEESLLTTLHPLYHLCALRHCGSRPGRGMIPSMNPTADDHVAITNLLARYCLTLDLDDVDAWVDLFTPDASYEVFGRSWEGHAGLRDMMRAAPRGLHLGGPPVIEMVAPNEARTTQNLLFVEAKAGTMRRSVYTDQLRRTEGGWRIAKRRCRFIVADGLSDRPDD